MENIDRILKQKKLTKKNLAKRMGISRGNLYRIINGNPTLENVNKLALGLEIPVWQLFAGSESVFNGYVEFQETTFRIQTIQDLQKLLELAGN